MKPSKLTLLNGSENFVSQFANLWTLPFAIFNITVNKLHIQLVIRLEWVYFCISTLVTVPITSWPSIPKAVQTTKSSRHSQRPMTLCASAAHRNKPLIKTSRHCRTAPVMICGSKRRSEIKFEPFLLSATFPFLLFYCHFCAVWTGMAKCKDPRTDRTDWRRW